MAAPEEQRLVDRYAEALDKLSDQAVANTDAALRRSLAKMLRDLRRWYQPYLDPTQVAASGGRPNSYSIAETASRFQSLVEAAQSFMPPEEIQRWQMQFQDDLAEAMALGGNLSGQLQETVSGAISSGFGAPNAVAVWSASQISTAYIQGETMRFRNEVTQIVTDGAARGRGYKSIEKQIRQALLGAKDPNGITQRLGLKQRAELIARSELANAYVEAQRRTARGQGFSYVRWIATKDERTCPLCVARHGQVYREDEVTGTAHPRCRCSLSPVINEAITETDKATRDELLEADYWRNSQQQAAAELAAAKGWDEARTRAELGKALRQVTPSERYRNPDATETVAPAVRF
jgi:SPP1 gp7 family putative phage head morphogenesis protein